MGIRDLIFAIMGYGCVPIALFNTYNGLLGYVWLSVMKPQSLVWSSSLINASLAYFVIIIVLIRHILFCEGSKIRMSPPVFGILFIWIWFAICALVSDYPDVSREELIKFSKVIVGPFLLSGMVFRYKKFLPLILLLAACPGIYGVKLGFFLFSGGTTTQGGPIGLDNNDTALFIAMGIPLLLYTAQEFKNKWCQRSYLLAAALSGPAIIATSSRGGLLSMITAYGLFLLFRLKSYKTLFLIPIVFFVLYSLVPQATLDRYRTIKSYEEDSSAMGRVIAWKTAMNIANDNFFGAGFGQECFLSKFPMYQPTDKIEPKAAHSAWFQVLGETGYIGLVLFVFMITVTARVGFRLRKVFPKGCENDGIGRYAEMLIIVLFTYVVGASFLSQAKFEFLYYVVSSMGCLFVIARDEKNKVEYA